jgi:hypothetical protein
MAIVGLLEDGSARLAHLFSKILSCVGGECRVATRWLLLKARVSPELKLQAKTVADRELLTEAAWLKRLVIREVRAANVQSSTPGK